ncbi:MAG TPA: class I SAM-dependent methyltransferase [Kofleriaceae bacterium]
MQFGLSAAAVLAVAACAHGAAPGRLMSSPTASDVTARSHALVDAYGRNDAAALEASLAAGFVQFENEHLLERAELIKAAAAAHSHHPQMTRTWKDEHVYVRDRDAVFIGMAVEHETGNDVHGNREYDGWYTIAWVRDGDAWKATQWSWIPHRTGLENARDTWNDNYRQAIGFNHAPNQLLVDTVRGVAPGTALDLMTGQGRNAVYLASQGWRVTGVDISDEGLKQTREAAAAHHLSVDTVPADAEAYDLGVARWDLVTMIYAGNSTKLIEKIKPSLKPGGRFVLEFFAREPGQPRGGFAPGQLRALFADGFEIERDDVVDGTPDWAKDHALLVRFVARKR